MDGGASVPDSPSRWSSDSFLALFAFWLHSVSTCFSGDADKLCVPVGLTLLSALLLLLSCLLIVCQRCNFRGEYSGESIMMFYSFLGNLCSSVGAVLSGQLHIQVFMAVFAAGMDAVSCVSCCLPVCLCWNSKTQTRLSVAKKRRRQHLLAVGVLMVVAGGFLKSGEDDPPESRPFRGRRLLHAPMQTSTWSLVDNSVILGYTLGLLSLVIALTSRFPALCRARRGQAFTQANVFSGLLSSLSGALYTAAILLSDARFGFLIRVLPWLLSSVSCAALDLLILLLHGCKRGIKQTIKISSDTESLLGSAAVHAEDAALVKQTSAQTKYYLFSSKTKNFLKLTEMGGYMDVSVQPARKQMSPQEVTLSKGGSEGGSLQRKVRVDSRCSSDTSYDSSPVSSDLEWDFEAAISQWSKPAAKPQEGDEFPLQDWPTKSKPFKVCICSMSERPQKTLCAKNKSGSAVG
ncbi:transmembrane protein 44 [Nematolebias whitei]|uniref:transmembrane protein 44 n=1 Tax=Nematolebias whitei TaxID=451745 RepID=UPI001896B719|nr:transmembrane protein 44 [Nematolebias whitei]